MADTFAHMFDAYWKGVGLTVPKSVVTKVQQSWKDSPLLRADTWPQSAHVTWTFPGNERTEGGELYPPKDVPRPGHEGAAVSRRISTRRRCGPPGS